MPDAAVSIVADTLRTHALIRCALSPEARYEAHCHCGWTSPQWGYSFECTDEHEAHVAAAVVDALGGLRKVQTDAELAALPDGSVIWYWVTYDGVEIHQQLMKHGDWWRNANDPDDAHEYFPTTERLDITLLRSGWVREPAEEGL